MKTILCVMMLAIATFGGNAKAQPRVTVTQDVPPPEPCAPGQPRDTVSHDASGVDETIKVNGLETPCLELTVHLPKAMDPALAPIIPTAPIDNDGGLDRHGTSTNDLIEISRTAASAANEVAKAQARWNFGLASQVLAVSHKGTTASYGLLGLYGVRATRATLVQLQGGLGKDSEGNLAIGAALMAGYKVGERAAVGIALTGTDSIDQRGDKDREVLMLRSVGVGPSVTMTLGSTVNVTIAGGVAWSGKPIDGRRVDGVLVEEPGRSYAFGGYGTVTLNLGLKGLFSK